MKYILAISFKNNYRLFNAKVYVIVITLSSISHLLQVKRKMINANICTSVRYNFKSDIIFYDLLGNKNGKLIHQIYIKFFFEQFVKLWITTAKYFVLEEDDDSGYSPSKKISFAHQKNKMILKVISILCSYLICLSLRIARQFPSRAVKNTLTWMMQNWRI